MEEAAVSNKANNFEYFYVKEERNPAEQIDELRDGEPNPMECLQIKQELEPEEGLEGKQEQNHSQIFGEENIQTEDMQYANLYNHATQTNKQSIHSIKSNCIEKTKPSKEETLMRTTLKVKKHPTDDSQIFGDYVASELHNLYSAEHQRKLKRLIQKSILEIQELDDAQRSGN